jgi:predicted dienelactone hydrolase
MYSIGSITRWILRVAALSLPLAPQAQAQFAFGSIALEFNDPTRSGREVGARVFYPIGASGPRRLVLISHGGFGTNPANQGVELTHFTHLAEPLASAGFVAVVVGHRSSVTSDQHRIDRPADIRFLIDRFAASEVTLPTNFGGSVVTDRVGHTGHSAGAYTAMAVGGATYPYGNFRDPRIAAIAPISPQGVGDEFEAFDNGNGDHSWATLNLPVLLSIGRDEIDTNGVGIFQAPGWRLQPYAALSAAFDRVQVVIDGQDHADMGGAPAGGDAAVRSFLGANITAFFRYALDGVGDPCVVGALALPAARVEVSRKGPSIEVNDCTGQGAGLILENGYESLPAAAGGERFIAARASTASEVFEGWRGDASVLVDPRAAHARVPMVERALQLGAEFRTVPTWSPREARINGSVLLYHAPPAPKGLVFRFHGSGGSARSNFQGAENLRFSEYLVAHGYAVAALDSVDRVSRQWSAQFSRASPDVVNVEAAIAFLTASGAVAPNTPVFAQGTSNGGGFASRVSALLAMRAQALVIADGIDAVMRETTVPTIWNLARRDSTLGPEAVTSATRYRDGLLARGIAAELNVLEPSPVYAQRFARIRGVSEADSLAIHAALKSAGVVDDANLLTANPRSDPRLATAIPAFAPRTEVIGQLELAYTEHEFMSDFQQRVLHFFDAALTPNYTGLWFVPTEPGWGLELAHQGEVLFPVWYTYDAQGRPTWYMVSGAPRESDGSYRGELFRFDGVPFDAIAGPATRAGLRVGEARIAPVSSNELSFRYTLDGVTQEKRLVRFRFGTPPICRFTSSSRAGAANRSDMWFNPAEPGWGVNLDEQDQTLFLTWYTYDASGRALWLTAQLARQRDGRFTGALTRALGGTPFDRIAGPATTFPLPVVGNATISFSDGERARFDYTLDGAAQSKPLTRFVYAGPAQTECM